MKDYLISYDLAQGSSEDYVKLHAFLRVCGAEQVLESVWFITSDKSASALYGGVATVLSNGDQLLVAEIDKRKYVAGTIMRS